MPTTNLPAIKRHFVSLSEALLWLFLFERGQLLTRRSVNDLLAAATARAGCRQRGRTCCTTRGYYLATAATTCG